MNDDFPEVGAGESPRLDYTPQPSAAHLYWLETEQTQTVKQISDNAGPYLVYEVKRSLKAHGWNRDYNQEAVCKCGHAYYRHFDTWEEMYPCGCKYCDDCDIFELKE